METQLSFNDLFLLDFNILGSFIVFRQVLDKDKNSNLDLIIRGVSYINIAPDFFNKKVTLEIIPNKKNKKYVFHTNENKKYYIIGVNHSIERNNLQSMESGLKKLEYYDQRQTINHLIENSSNLNDTIDVLKAKIVQLERK